MAIKKAGVLLLFTMIIVGCATPKYQAQNINLSGFPPEYRAGYDDGCSSAKFVLIPKKDTDRFKTDKLYAQGWKDGNDLCKKGNKK